MAHTGKPPKGIINKLGRLFLDLVVRTRVFKMRMLKDLARRTRGKTVLEIGSGPKENGVYAWSVQEVFRGTHDFLMSDIDPSYGHPIIDVTRMKEKNKYDVILCTSTLEHVYDYQASIDNMHRALKKDGILAVLVPYAYPLHAEPDDFWRFTEHALRRMFKAYKITKFRKLGVQKFPQIYYLEATKP